MKNEPKKSRRESRTENDLGFLKEAVKNGDQQAVEILQTLSDLDDELSWLQSEIAERKSQPGRTERERAEWYRYMISGMNRIQEIPVEKERIIHEAYGLERKKIKILLQSIKRRKIEDKLLYNWP
ncbi:MAG: hypothetical protein WCR01_11335 [Bacteroidota bacterium]